MYVCVYVCLQSEKCQQILKKQRMQRILNNEYAKLCQKSLCNTCITDQQSLNLYRNCCFFKKNRKFIDNCYNNCHRLLISANFIHEHFTPKVI